MPRSLRVALASIASIAFTAAAAAALWRGGAHILQGEAAASPRGAGGPAVVVELFSSEGCSSCPPADAFVARLDRDQPVEGATVIPIEEHVDYWDDLGWRDPYGSPAHGARQRQYASVLDDHGVFTPEVVIDGRFVMPTGDEAAARRLIQEAARGAKARVTLAREGDHLAIDVAGAPASASDPAEIWLAVTESNLATEVPRGENAGRRLVHAPIARALRRIARIDGSAAHAEATLERGASWKAGALRAVVFVQLASSRRIVGAAVIER
jgi:hypothetical protein